MRAPCPLVRRGAKVPGGIRKSPFGAGRSASHETTLRTRPVVGFAVGRGLSAAFRVCGPHGPAAGHRPGVRVVSAPRGAPRPATALYGARRRWAAARPSGPAARARPLVGPPNPTALCGVDEPAGAPPLTVPPPELGTVTGLEAVDRAVRHRRERSQQKAALVAPAAGDGAD